MKSCFCETRNVFIKNKNQSLQGLTSTIIMGDLIQCSLNVFEKKLSNPLFNEFDLSLAKKIHKFHKTIPGYEKTPLVHLKQIAKKIHVNQLWSKDESKRFGLNAYKFLGVSYSIAKSLLDPNEGIYLQCVARNNVQFYIIPMT